MRIFQCYFIICILLFALSCDSTIPNGEHAEQWLKCFNKSLPYGSEIEWPIKVFEVSTFGGDFSKAYLSNCKQCKIYIIGRIPIGTLIIKGKYKGVTKDGEVILSY